MLWRKVTLVGVGLLGGSLGLALKKRGLAALVEGYVRREATIQEALACGAVDHASTDLEKAVRGANLIVLCTPLAQMIPLAHRFASQVVPGVVVTDVGSVKAPLVAELEPLFSKHRATFVGSHPMAGSAKMGVSAARADLFEGAACVVTPSRYADPNSDDATPVILIESLWRGVGAFPMRLSPEQHDEVVARSSHLPHVLAAHLASYVLDPKEPYQQARLCANGFRDSTRIASGSPEMWRDIVMMNRGAVSGALKEFSTYLREFEAVLERNSAAEIQEFFEKAKTLRDAWKARCASSAE
ncbi:MAG TPA: prephenate dehydrogenase/arogenate dehydrogenase family protein [Verrucomicrobiae bacterium]|jgi:prephenate dehydrogenase|nr:prephenate dehydrogenase/arogenate dehydrogenase family protein [Verrucomicrobiae bacterium]